MKWILPLLLLVLLLPFVSAQSNLGDLNGDGVVDIGDVLIVAGDIGRSSGFDSRSDRNGDGVVNVFDLVLVAKYWGSTYSSTFPVNGNVIFEDDFESGDLSKWDNVDVRYSITSNSSRVANGDYAVEAVMTPSDGQGALNKWFLPGYDELYYKYKIMYEEGWQGGMHGAAITGNRIDNKWSSHGQAGVKPDGTDFFFINVDPDGNWPDDPGPHLFYAYWPNMSCFNYGCYGNLLRQSAPEIPVVPGVWQEVVVHMKLNTPGGYDSVLEMWVDGEKKIEQTGLLWRETTDLRLNEFALHIYSSNPPQTQHVWVDDVVVWQPNNSSVDTVAPVRSSGNPSGTLSAGLTSVTLSLSTDEVATCAYSNSSGVSYSGMTQMENTGGTSHSQVVFVSDGNGYDYYVKCRDESGNTNSNDFVISFSVASNSSGSALFTDDFESYGIGETVSAGGSENFDWFVPAGSVVVSDGQSYSGGKSLRFRWPASDGSSADRNYWSEQRFALSSASASSELWVEYYVFVPVNWDHRQTDVPATNHNKLFAIWHEDYQAKSEAVLVVLEYARQNETASHIYVSSAKGTGYETREMFEEGVHVLEETLFDDSMRGSWVRLRYHIKAEPDGSIIDAWRDDEKILEIVSDYSIVNPDWTGVTDTFRNGYLFGWANSAYDEQTDFYIDDFKFYTTDPGWSYSADITPPIRSNGAPSDTMSAGTTSATLTLSTDETATCAYSNSSGVAYSGMTQMSSTGGNLHSQQVSVSDGASYNYYVKCQDSSGNTNSDDYTISFSVDSASSGSGGVLFYSDWSTATGTSDAATRDTSKDTPWPVVGNPNSRIEVVSASGLNFPTTNVLRVQWPGGGVTGYGNVRINTGNEVWDALANHESLYHRIYLRNDMLDAEPRGWSGHHPLESGKVGGSSGWSWSISPSNGNDGTYTLHLRLLNSGWPDVDFSLGSWSHLNGPLLKGHTYRLEWKFTRNDPVYDFAFRLYDESGTLLYTEADFYNELGETLVEATGATFTPENHDIMRRVWVGENDWAVWAPSQVETFYWGAYCVRSDTWCGAYSGGI